MTEIDDAELERHFAAARTTPPEPNPAFLAQAVADARQHQPPKRPSSTRLGPGRIAGMFAWLGRAAMPMGLAMATLVGVWIGVSARDTVAQPAAMLMETGLGMDLVHRFPTLGGFLEEI